MKFRFVYKVYDGMRNFYLAVLKRQDGFLKDGVFNPIDFSTHDIVDTTENLILQKGKFKISLRNENTIERHDPIGMISVDNSSHSFNRLWGNEETIKEYLVESRILFFEAVYSLCRKYFKDKVVDVGCGSGDFLKIVNSRLPHVEINGMDFSLSGIQRCRQLVSNGMFAVGNVYGMGYKDNSFDVVVCMEVLEHLESPKIAYHELRRICRKRGVIIITIPNGDVDGFIGHLNFWNYSEFKIFLGDADLTEFHNLEAGKSMLFVIRN